MEDSLHEMSQAIGQLQATVKGMTDQWARQEDAAASGRRELYQRFEGLSTQFTKLDGTVTQAVKDISIMQPVVRLFQDGQQRIQGAKGLGKVLWTAVTIVFTALASLVGGVAWLLHQLFGAAPPPH